MSIEARNSRRDHSLKCADQIAHILGIETRR